MAPTKPLNPYRLTPQPGAPAWGDAPIIMAWDHWLRYGDRDFLARFYPSFQAWMEHIGRPNPDFIRRNAVYNNYGDWLSVGPASDRTLVATAYWHRVADLMARIADTLGHATDSAAYNQLARSIAKAFCAEYLDKNGRLTGDTQTAYLLALDFNLLPEAMRPAATKRLVELIEAADGHLKPAFWASVISAQSSPKTVRLISPSTSSSRTPIPAGAFRSVRAQPPSGSAGTAGPPTRASRAST